MYVCVCMSFVVLYLMLYLFVVIAEKGIAKMKDDDIEKLFESMKEEFKLIYRKEQEKKKETAEKAARTRLHTAVAKYNEVREKRLKAIEERRNGNRVKLPSIVFPGWVHPGYVGGEYDPFFGGELYAHYLYLHCITNHNT